MCPKWFCNNKFFYSSIPFFLDQLFIIPALWYVRDKNTFLTLEWIKTTNIKPVTASTNIYILLYKGLKYAILFDPLIGSQPIQ